MMNPDLLTSKGTEKETFKQAPTMDEILQGRLDPLIEEINQNNAKTYQDFNMAMHAQHSNLVKVEKDITHMNQILWGIVNDSNVRLLALEKVLTNNGLDPKQIEDEVLNIHAELEKTGKWKQVPMEQVAKQAGIIIDQKSPGSD